MYIRWLPKQINLFFRSFGASAFIGLCYITLLEIAQWVLGYNSGLIHSIVAFCFYIIGILANYSLQKNVVFSASNSPLAKFFIYNISSAALVSGLSGYLYSTPWLQAIFKNYIESASTAIALLIISPITFIVLKKIFHHTS